MARFVAVLSARPATLRGRQERMERDAESLRLSMLQRRLAMEARHRQLETERRQAELARQVALMLSRRLARLATAVFGGWAGQLVSARAPMLGVPRS